MRLELLHFRLRGDGPRVGAAGGVGVLPHPRARLFDARLVLLLALLVQAIVVRVDARLRGFVARGLGALRLDHELDLPLEAPKLHFLRLCARDRVLVGSPRVLELPAQLTDLRLRAAARLFGLGGPALGLLESVDDMPIDPLPDRSTVLVDPGAIALEVDPEAEPCVMGREFLGQAWQYRIQAGDLHLRLSVPLDQDVPRGTRCRLTFLPEATAILFPHRIRVRASDPCDDATLRAVPRTRPAEKG